MEKYSGVVFKGCDSEQTAIGYLRDYFIHVTGVHDLHLHADVIHEDSEKSAPEPSIPASPAREPKPVMGFVVCNGYGELIGLASTLERARVLRDDTI